MDKNNLLNSQKYSFLKTNERLRNNIILLTLGGSYAYGTNIETSDIDIRGIVNNSVDELLGITPEFKQYKDETTDTIIYGLKKVIRSVSDCNPNYIEMLGSRKEDYLFCNNAGQILLDNKEIFLSQKAIKTFNGYSNLQLELAKKYCEQKDTNNKIKISKPMMHSVRSLMTGADILGNGIIKIFRDGIEHDILMSIRNGNYVTDNNEILPEFFDILEDYRNIFLSSSEKTLLPLEPNYRKINDLTIEINKLIL